MNKKQQRQQKQRKRSTRSKKASASKSRRPLTAAASSFSLHTYTGRDHLRRIKSQIPIPGTQLRQERDQIENHDEILLHKPRRISVALRERTAADRKLAYQVRSELEDVRSKYGWQKQHTINSSLKSRITNEVEVFRTRKDPNPNNLPQLSRQQRLVYESIVDRDHRPVHLAILKRFY